MRLCQSLLIFYLTFFSLLAIFENAKAGEVSEGIPKEAKSSSSKSIPTTKDKSAAPLPAYLKDLSRFQEMEVTIDVYTGELGISSGGLSKKFVSQPKLDKKADSPKTSTLDKNHRTITRDFLRYLLKEYPLDSSFRGIQDVYLLAPMNAIYFRILPRSRGGDLFESSFHIGLYGPPEKQYIELLYWHKGTYTRQTRFHENREGCRIPFKGEVAIKFYSLFADVLEKEKPDEAAAIRKRIEIIRSQERAKRNLN